MRKWWLALLVLLVLDALWLTVIAGGIYREQLQRLVVFDQGNMVVHWGSAALVYVFLLLGIIFFPVAQARGYPALAWLYGFLFGLVVYGTYGFTNHAVLRDWPFLLSVMDTLWGGVLCGWTAMIVCFFADKSLAKTCQPEHVKESDDA